MSVTISHAVANVNTHYIYLVEIWKNDILFDSFDYTSQPSNLFTYDYVINATNGDVLKVKASCNQGGSATESIVLTDGSWIPTGNVSAINVSLGGALFISVSSILFMLNKKRDVHKT